MMLRSNLAASFWTGILIFFGCLSSWPAYATRYSFLQQHFSGGGSVSGTFSGHDRNGDGAIAASDGEVGSFSFKFQGDSIVPQFDVDSSTSAGSFFLNYYPRSGEITLGANYGWGSPWPQAAFHTLGGMFGFADYKTSYTDLNWSYTSAPMTITQHQTFALLIGVRDTAVRDDGSLAESRGDLSAYFIEASIRHALPDVQLDFVAVDRTAGQSLSALDVSNKLMVLKGKINPGDDLLVYVQSHGTSENIRDSNVSKQTYGNELLMIGPKQTPEDLALQFSDDDLTRILYDLDPKGEIRKSVFLDACHAGGFWGSRDPWEFVRISSSAVDLDFLRNIAVFAASGEGNNAYGDYWGLAYYSQALSEAFRNGYFHSRSTDGFAEAIHRRYYELAQGNPDWVELGLGDIVAADQSLLRPVFFADAVYTAGETVGNSVPEPSVLFMVVVGVAMLTLTQKPRKTAGSGLGSAVLISNPKIKEARVRLNARQ